MKQTRHPRLHLAGLISGLAAFAVVTSAQFASASAAQSPAAQFPAAQFPAAQSPAAPVPKTRCAWTADQLPRTPDAVEAWYRGCERPTLARTPDVVEAWTC